MPDGTAQVSLPSDLITVVQAAADRQHRPLDALITEAVETRLAAGCHLPISDTDRGRIRTQISEGVTSARAGRLVDGEVFFGQLLASLGDTDHPSQV